MRQANVRIAATLMRHWVTASLFLLALPAIAHASLLRTWSYAEVSPDGRRVFVMLTSSDQGEPLTVKLLDGHEIDVRATFAESVEYDTSTLGLVWKINRYAFPFEICWFDDFEHYALLNRFAIARGPAVSFFHQNKLVRQYSPDEILTGLGRARFLPFTSGDWHYVWYDQFNREGNGLALSTTRREYWLYGHRIDLGRKEFYTFDLVTGEITSRRVMGAWYVWAYGAGFVGALAASLFVFRLGWRRARRELLVRRRSRLGLCMECGYDLRASQTACPECGKCVKARPNAGMAPAGLAASQDGETGSER